ncbi:MAG: tyrosine-protein phosphatase [Myxococcaceae bacterium]
MPDGFAGFPGFVDLHCHLLYGVDDGAKTIDDSLEMARALCDLGFSDVAPSPHARREYAEESLCRSRLSEIAAALKAEAIPLSLHPNAENFFFEPGFLEDFGDRTRKLGAGKYVLVEAPYTAPVSVLPELIFRMKIKGVTPLIAHPERCMEFEKKGRAKEAVDAGALLQLDIGAITGRYGGTAKKLSRQFLEDGLYAVAATDLHSPVGARDWVGKAIKELRTRAGEGGAARLLGDHPRRLLQGLPLEA